MSEPPTDPAHGAYSRDGIFTYREAIRAYEPGANRRLSIGNLLRYCELVANAASAAAGFGAHWYVDRGEGWVVFRQTIELAASIGPGAALDLSTWVRAYSRVSAQRDYRLRHATTGRDVARATTTWAYVDRVAQTPRRIPPEILAHIPIHSHPSLPARVGWGEPIATAPTTTLHWRARTYEADQLGHINNCVYADWLAEAAALAIAEWGAGTDALALVSRLPLLPRRAHLYYQRSARPGDAITITTTPVRLAGHGLALTQIIAPTDQREPPYLTATTEFVGLS